MRHRYLLAGLLMVLGTFFWGSAFAAIRFLLKNLEGNPFYLLFCRFIPAGVFFLFYILFTARDRIKTAIKEDGWRFLGSALTGILIYHLAINLGETVVRADVASFIIATIPLLTIATATLVYRQKQNRGIWTGALISLVGVYLLITQSDPGETITIGENLRLSPLLGYLLIFICPVTMIFYTFISRPLSQKYPPSLSLGIGFVLAAIPILFSADRKLFHLLSSLSLSFWLVLNFLVLGSTITGYIFWITALKLTNPSFVNLFLYLNPIWGLISNQLLFPAETISPGMLVGGLFIISGVAIGTGLLNHLYPKSH